MPRVHVDMHLALLHTRSTCPDKSMLYLAVVHLPLNQEGLHTTLGQGLSGASTRGTTTDDSDTQRPVQSGTILNGIDGLNQTTRCGLGGPLHARNRGNNGLTSERGGGQHRGRGLASGGLERSKLALLSACAHSLARASSRRSLSKCSAERHSFKLRSNNNPTYWCLLDMLIVHKPQRKIGVCNLKIRT